MAKDSTDKKSYEVLPGTAFVNRRPVESGDVIELTEAESAYAIQRGHIKLFTRQAAGKSSKASANEGENGRD